MKGWKGDPIRHALASKGIRTSFNQDKQYDSDLNIVEKRVHGTSYRNYRPDDFMEHSLIDEETIDREKYIEARRVYNELESGRFRDMMNSFANFFANLDSDEQEVWADNNPEMMNWLGVHGFLQQLKTFEDWTGVPSFYSFEVVNKSDMGDIE